LIEKDFKIYKNAGYSYLRLRWYTVESTNSEILNLYSNNWYVRYRWKKVWKTTLLLRKNWKLKYKLNIEVVEKKKLILEWWRTQTLYLNKEKKLKILSWNGSYNTKYIYPKWFLETKIIKENNKDYLVLKLKEIPKYKYPRLYLVDEANNYFYIRVIPKLNEIKVDKEKLKVYKQGYKILKITNWNGDYKIYKNNENILVEKINDLEYKIYGKKIWKTILKVVDGYGKSKNVEVEVEDEFGELMRELEKLFEKFGIKINSVWEGVEVNSTSNSERCELGRTGIYWSRPYNAVCVDNNKNNAWKCKTWYVDLFKIDWTNSCVAKNELKKVLKYKKYIKLFRKIWAKIKSNNLKKLYQKILQIRNKNKNAILLYILDDLLNELDKNQNPKIKEYQDVYLFWNELKIASNNWQVCYDWCEDYDNWRLKWKSRAEIEKMIDVVVVKTINYSLKYDENFKKWYNNEINKKLKENKGLTKEQITKSVKDWITNATKDYFKWIIDKLKDLDIWKIWDWIWWIWQTVSHPIDTLKKLAKQILDFKNKIEKLYETIYKMEDTEKIEWWSYAWTTTALALADPSWKIEAAMWNNKLEKVSKSAENYVGELKKKDDEKKRKKDKCHPTNPDFKKAFPGKKIKITWKTCSIFKLKIWKLELKKYWDLIEKIKATKKDVSFRIERLDLMDKDILKKHLNNPSWYVNSFSDGKYPMLIKQQIIWEQTPLIFKNGKFVHPWTWFTTKNAQYDYVLVKDWKNYELKFWKSHSWLVNWKNVEYAWIFKLSSWKKWVDYLNNGSWHYKPNFNNTEWKKILAETFYKKFWIDISNKIKNYEWD